MSELMQTAPGSLKVHKFFKDTAARYWGAPNFIRYCNGSESSEVLFEAYSGALGIIGTDNRVSETMRDHASNIFLKTNLNDFSEALLEYKNEKTSKHAKTTAASALLDVINGGMQVAKSVTSKNTTPAVSLPLSKTLTTPTSVLTPNICKKKGVIRKRVREETENKGNQANKNINEEDQASEEFKDDVLRKRVREEIENEEGQVNKENTNKEEQAGEEELTESDIYGGICTPTRRSSVSGEIPIVELKLLRKCDQSSWDENTYTALWVNPDLISLYTGTDVITSICANENHFSPSSWRRSLARDKANCKGTNVDGFYSGYDGMVDLIVENVGSPLTTNHTKKLEDEKKSWRNSADALLERFYLSTGSIHIAKEYEVMTLIVYDKDKEFHTKDQVVFQTGSTGLVGKNPLEKILHSLSQVKKVYLLIRVREEKTFQARVENDIFSSRVFDTLRYVDGQKFPEKVMSKVTLVQGDITLEGPGMSAQNTGIVQTDCTIVVNCAVSIIFVGPLRATLHAS
ncbi:hypothetical protein BGZ49_001209 [Haplosporangium sp. Z 27]|nr:hypothetical protein BGZ49_001209 [Haplosporangium sp. Z 27]